MADTRDDVIIPQSTWVNLYAATGIAVGTAVSVINKGSVAVNLAVSASAPANTNRGFPLLVGGGVDSTASVEATASGLWAYSSQGTAYLLVQE
jgi:hypothetical protein